MEYVVRIGLPLGECVGLQHRQKLAAFPTQHRQGGALMLGDFGAYQGLGSMQDIDDTCTEYKTYCNKHVVIFELHLFSFIRKL